MTNVGKMNNCPIFLGRNCCKKVDFQFVNICPEMLQFISEGPVYACSMQGKLLHMSFLVSHKTRVSCAGTWSTRTRVDSYPSHLIPVLQLSKIVKSLTKAFYS